MSKPKITRVPSVDDRSLPVFAELETLTEKIRRRAFELFSERGFAEGDEFNDWYRAEREICWPASELVENDDGYELKLELAGFDAGDITVTATPRELVVEAAHQVRKGDAGDDDDSHPVVRWSELHRENVCRSVTLPAAIDADRVKAEFKRGLLTVRAPKTDDPADAPRRIDVSTAA